MRREKPGEGLRARFDARGYGVAKYARANRLDRSTLSRVLSGRLNGSRISKIGNTRRAILALERDGVWLDPLPWEDRR